MLRFERCTICNGLLAKILLIETASDFLGLLRGIPFKTQFRSDQLERNPHCNRRKSGEIKQYRGRIRYNEHFRSLEHKERKY